MLYHYLSQSHDLCFLLEISGQTLQFSLSPAVSAKIYEATRLTPLRRRVPSCWADPAMKLHDIFLLFLQKKGKGKKQSKKNSSIICWMSCFCVLTGLVFISNLIYTNISWFWIPIVMDWPECPPASESNGKVDRWPNRFQAFDLTPSDLSRERNPFLVGGHVYHIMYSCCICILICILIWLISIYIYCMHAYVVHLYIPGGDFNPFAKYNEYCIL